MSVNTKVNGELVKSAGLYKVSVPIQSGDIYSFEERQVGVWADGKPLYQKTIDFGTLPNASLKSVAHGISDLENAFIVGAFSKNSTKVIIPLPYTTSTASDQMQVYVDTTNVNIRPQGNATSFTTTFVTIQYTKTTDVAGSGEYVPSGDKAVHYSTEEEVIGTWIDGKTLYRRAFDLGADTNISSTQWTASGITIPNLSAIADAKSTNSSGTFYPLMAYHTSGAVNLLACRDGQAASSRWIILEYTKTS